MAIKIGGANLIKRYINGQSIKKVMYNGLQIWGEGIIPPPVDYHIIGDFTGGMPSGWTSTGGSVSGGGLRNGGARWNSMPSLANAIRIKIVYNLDVDGDSELSGEIKNGNNTYYGTTMGNDGGLTQNLHSLFFPNENTSEVFANFPAGTYIITADMDLVELTAIQELECPPLGRVENSEISITQEDVNLIRTGTVFDILANASTVIHKIDFYIWYGHSQQEWVPEGYAVPEALAYNELITELTNMGVPGDLRYSALHMPLVGFGSMTSTGRSGFGDCTYMRTPSPYGGAATSMYIDRNGAHMFWSDGRSYGQPVRCFKDEYIAPDSSWVTEWEDGNAGIYRSQQLGLISITDGNNYNITMSDKNLGATITWKLGDSLNDANCGLYYQWGNCYGFSFAGGFTTDTQCVDTREYGYGNYYSRGVYVLLSGDWSCNQNDGLWDPNPYTPVSGISLQEAGDTITLQPGETYQLHASVTPSSASNKGISYSISGSTGAGVDRGGLITVPSTGATSGTVTVYAVTDEGGYTAACTLVVDTPYIPIRGIAVDVDSNMMVPGGIVVATVRSSPSNATQEAELRLSESWASATPSTSYIIGDTLYKDYTVSIGQDAPIGGMVKIEAWIGSGGSYEWVSIVPMTQGLAINFSAAEVPQGSSFVAQVIAVPETLSDYISLEESRYGLSRDLTRTIVDNNTVYKYYTINVRPDADVGNITLTARAGLADTSRSILITTAYEANWLDKDGNIIETDYVPSGETPVFNGTTPSCYDPEETTTEECVFDHWSPTPGPIYSDTTYYPVFRNINEPDPDDDF